MFINLKGLKISVLMALMLLLAGCGPSDERLVGPYLLAHIDSQEVFKELQDLVMSDFNGQNVIHSLDIAVDAMSDTLEASVSIESSWGLKGTFRCKSAQVESLEKLPVPDTR